MFDLRIYRTALLPAVAAFALMMFTFEPAPEPLPPPVTSPVFEGTDATRTARGLLGSNPEMGPGSPGDRAAENLVRERFGEIRGGVVTEQTVEVEADGEERESANVILTLPGSSEQTVVVAAPRATESESRAADVAAATATLVELADYLGDSRHSKTIVLASVAGGEEGRGTKALIEALGERPVEAAIVIDRPGRPDPEPPFVSTPAGGKGIPAQLTETAYDITTTRFDQQDGPRGLWGGLAALAFPQGTGKAIGLHEGGMPALGIGSGTGDFDPGAGGLTGRAAIDADSLSASGGSVLELVLTLDEGDPPKAGPATYLRLGDNLVPGWTIAVFALSLLIAPLLCSLDTWARALRADRRTRRTAFWAAERVLVPFGALLLIALLGLVGLIPDPPYPFDPTIHQPGATAIVVFSLIALVAILIALLIRPMRTPLDSEPHALAAAAGFLTTLGVLGVWALDPFLALLLAPAAHVWVLPARPSGPPRPWLVTLACLLSLLPAAAAFLTRGAQLGLDPYEAIWVWLLLLADGAVGPLLALCGCLVLGGLLASISSAGESGAGGRDSLNRPRGGRQRVPLAPVRDSLSRNP